MQRKNQLLLGVILVLLALNLFLQFGRKEASGLAYDEAMFAIRDTSSIRTIEIGEVLLARDNGQWLIQDEVADPAFIDHLLNVMLRVRVKKPLGTSVEEGITVEINGEEVFDFSSNPTKTRTFFSQDGEAYEVEIPGFSDYLGGIFELHPDQWRDRLVYDGSWRTIQRLQLDYMDSDENDFTILFEDDFFKVPGVNQLDTTALMNYLNQFQFFQANERISSGRIPELDSLADTSPVAVLTIDDIKYEASVKLKIFPRLSDQSFHLLLDPKGEKVAIDARRTDQMLKSLEDFKW